MFNKGIKPDSPQGKKLEVCLVLIRDYEDRNFSIPLPDPIEAIKLKLDESKKTKHKLH